MTSTRLLATVLAPTGLLLSMGAWSSAAGVPSSATTPGSTLAATVADTATPRAIPAYRLVVTPSGNAARYRIQERLVGMDLPYDAVGETQGVGGQIVIDTDGKVIAEESRIVVDVRKLTSDKDRRDKYVRKSLLETEEFPVVQLRPTELRGLPKKIPTMGAGTFQLIGNLTIHGVTRPSIWKVTARFEGDRIVGRAVTTFTFDDFDLKQPRVPVVLTLADRIQLEYDFNLSRDAASTF